MKYVEKYQRNSSGGVSLHGAHPHWQGSSPGGTRTSELNNWNGAFFVHFSYVMFIYVYKGYNDTLDKQMAFNQSPSSNSNPTF